MSDTHIRVLDSDYERLGGLAERFTQKIGEYRFLAMVEGHCAALSIEIDGRFVCTIYEQRPAVCRELEPASAACLSEIDQNRDSSLIALESLMKKSRARAEISPVSSSAPSAVSEAVDAEP